MKTIIALLFLIPNFSYAAKCPDSVQVHFGTIEETSSKQMLDLELTTKVFKKVSEKRSCHYRTDVFLLGLTIHNHKTRKPYLVIERINFDENPGYRLRVDLLKKAFVRGVQVVNHATFDIYDMYFDEEYPEVFGFTRFNRLGLNLSGQEH